MFHPKPLSSPSHLLALRLSTSVLALTLAGALAAPGFAAETVVTSGMTVGQQLLTPGDKLTIEAGATVTDNITPVYDNGVNGTYTVVNKGSIQIANGNSISLHNLDLDNSGSIVSVAGGGIFLSGTSKIVNSGLISGHDALLSSSTIASLNNALGGTITGDEYAVQATTVDLLDNAGLINGDYIALSLASLGTLNNSATGVITNHTATQAAISIGGNAGTINNAGGIEGQKSAIGVSGDLGVLNNSGHITSTDSATGTTVYATSIGSVDNSGTIDGGDIGINATTIGAIDNSGSINGEDSAIYAGTIASLVNAGVLTSDDTTVYSTVTMGSLTNSGEITSTGYYGVRGNDVGSLVNSGTISGTRFGFYGDGVLTSLNNSGTMTGADYAAAAGSIGTVTNSGLLQSNETALFSYGDIASVYNTATGQMMSKYGIWSQANIGSVTNAGKIVGEFGGLEAFGSIASIVNTGSITITDPANGDAVVADALGSLDNSGYIGGGWSGISIANAIGSVTNRGTISAVNESLSGQTIGSVDNSGTISGGDHAISAFSHIGSVRNSGNIIGQAEGISVLGGDLGSLENSGNITALSTAIYADTAIHSLANTGTIRGGASAVESDAIYSLTNSGLIAAADPSGNAIIENDPSLASDTLLTLNAGSILIGHVDIHGGTNTLNVGNGLNLALTFDTSVPELIETNGAPYVIVGNTVYVADMAAFAAAGVATSDLTNAIGGATRAALDEGFAEKGLDGQGHFWLQALGGVGHDGPTGMDLGYGGVVGGLDFGPDAVTRVGAFGGASRGAVGSQSDVSSFYAGVYGAAQFEDFSLKGTLTGGATAADTERLVANNTLATGIEAASSTQDAYFIAPSLLISRPWQTQDFGFVTSLGLNYTGVFGSSFTEDAATGLTVDGYNTHVFQAQGLLHLPFERILDGGILTEEAHAGLEARAVVAPDITGSLAGTAMTLASSNTQATAGAVAGGSLKYNLTGGASIFGGVDAVIRTDGSAVLSANAGLKAEF